MRAFFLTALLFFAAIASAQTPPTNTELEMRARDVGHALRCVVCQNQSIEESDASLAKDMRVIVREQMREGKTDREVIEYMRERYGDYVLLKPPFQSNTYALWFIPALLVAGMALWLFLFSRRRLAAISADPLTQEELNVLKRLMDDPS